MSVHQKLGMILENKIFQKLKLSKKCQYMLNQNCQKNNLQKDSDNYDIEIDH